MPRRLTFLWPSSVEEAISMLGEHGERAKVAAGSTALTIMLRQGLIMPEALVGIGRLDGLGSISEEDDHLRLGALATHRQVELSPVVREHIPVLAETFARIANVRIRNVATAGGVVCEADYASDPPAALLALDAQVEAQGPSGTRLIPVRDFFRAFYTTALEPTEIVTAIRVPFPPAGTHGVYEKFVTRSSEDRPCVGVMASVRLADDGQTCAEARVAVGAAAEIPQRFEELEQIAHGTELSDEVAHSIAEGYADRIDTLDDVRGSAWYRTQMIKVWVRRALRRAYEDARAAAARS